MNDFALLTTRLLIVILSLLLTGSAWAMTGIDSMAGLWWTVMLALLVFIVVPWWVFRFLRRVRRDSQKYDQTMRDGMQDTPRSETGDDP